MWVAFCGVERGCACGGGFGSGCQGWYVSPPWTAAEPMDKPGACSGVWQVVLRLAHRFSTSPQFGRADGIFVLFSEPAGPHPGLSEPGLAAEAEPGTRSPLRLTKIPSPPSLVVVRWNNRCASPHHRASRLGKAPLACARIVPALHNRSGRSPACWTESREVDGVAAR